MLGGARIGDWPLASKLPPADDLRPKPNSNCQEAKQQEIGKHTYDVISGQKVKGTQCAKTAQKTRGPQKKAPKRLVPNITFDNGYNTKSLKKGITKNLPEAFCWTVIGHRECIHFSVSRSWDMESDFLSGIRLFCCIKLSKI